MPIFRYILFIVFCLICRSSFSQQPGSAADSLTGYVTFHIDLLALKDTIGVFRLGVGGLPVTLKKEGNTLSGTYYIKEPRRSFLSFYPQDTINKYPNEQLNNIASRYEDLFEFLAMPGTTDIAAGNVLLNSQINNARKAQTDYADLVKKGWKNISDFAEKNQHFITRIQNERDKKKKDSLQHILDIQWDHDEQVYYKNEIFNFVKNNPDSPAPLVFLEDYSSGNNLDLRLMASLYNRFTDRIKNLPSAKRFSTTITSLSFNKKIIGKTAPDFTLTDANGKKVSLQQFKGKVTLVEFWASWCGPCLASVPGLVKVYHKYKANGFNILGVSLDLHKDEWLKAIAKYKLAWPQVSELKGFEGNVCALYQVSGIPANFLIDEQGTVVAAHLDEKELDQNLSRLYQQKKTVAYSKNNLPD